MRISVCQTLKIGVADIVLLLAYTNLVMMKKLDLNVERHTHICKMILLCKETDV